MAHGKEKQDLIFSTKSTEWHGLAIVRAIIGKPEIDQASFNILETEVGFNVDGIHVPMKGHKIIAADLRHRLDLPEDERIVGLHIPKTGYNPISNREIFEQAEEICRALGMSITTMGTLEGCKKFFLSIDTGSSELSVKNYANGKVEKILSHINMVTSHDGTMAQETYDSMIRIVCMNTFRWSRLAKGSIGGKVFHTKNSKMALDAMTNRIIEIVSGRKVFVETMEKLSQITVNRADAFSLSLAYLAQARADGENTEKVSTRSVNAAESIANLFDRGKGNVGKSRYDLFNGATEYWTDGDGTGKKLDAASKRYKGLYGAASDHKTDFLAFIEKDDLGNEIETGRALHANYLSAAGSN
jgi:hypothetical protein